MISDKPNSRLAIAVRADGLAAIRNFLTSHRDVAFEAVPSPSVTLEKGETLAQAIERIRLRIQSLASEKSRVERAGMPTADLKHEADDYVDGLVAKGQPKIIAEHGKPFGVVFHKGDTFADEGLAAHLPAIIAWLAPERFKTKLHASIDKLPQPTLAMPASERKRKLEAIAAELLALARQEEVLIERSEAAGEPILRRPNADIRAVLGIGKAGEAKAAKSKEKRVRAEAAG